MKSATWSSRGPSAGTPAELRRWISSILRRPVTSLRKVGGGRNSRVYRVCAPPEAPFAAKSFFHLAPDRRHRPAVEFEGLRFLWRHGERRIPRPLGLHPARACAFYEFVKGQPLPPGRVTGDHLAQALDFLARLKGLAGAPGSRRLPRAAEACFSLDELEANLRWRRERLLAIPGRESPYPALRRFLRGPFKVTAEALLARARRGLRGLPRILPVACRTLSPSDFGFHNSILTPGGRLVFVDFEYFGWDDPAKTVSDFLLHPAMRLPTALRREFLRGALEVYGGDSNLEKRLASLYPLYGLKWCLILLNEFVPQDFRRRTFAGGATLAPALARRRQLARARRLLARISTPPHGLDAISR